MLFPLGGGLDAGAVIENRRETPPPFIFSGQHLVVLPSPQWDASFGYLHWAAPLTALVDPQWDASFGYLH